MPAETHVSRGPMGPDEVFALIRDRLSEILEIDEATVLLDSSFTEDLEADGELLERALSHRSWCAEHPGNPSNERLEFLGDAILGMVVTDRIFRDYPDLPEGELAKVRASVVSAVALAEVAADLDLGSHVLLGRGEEQSGGRGKASILADAMEAVIGAVYLDGGLDRAQRVVLDLVSDRVEEASRGPGGRDYKTRLQELAVARFDETPRYEIKDAGPDHAKEFHATVFLAGQERGSGRGSSKKQAEQEAAGAAWALLEARGDAERDRVDEVSVEDTDLDRATIEQGSSDA